MPRESDADNQRAVADYERTAGQYVAAVQEKVSGAITDCC